MVYRLLDLLANVKANIQDKEGLNIAGQWYENGRTLSEYNILKELLLLLLTFSWRHDRQGIPPFHHHLISAGNQLEDDRTLSKFFMLTLADLCCLRGGMQTYIKTLADKTITLELRLRAGMQMYVQTLAGKTNIFEIEASDVFNSAQAKTQNKESFMTIWQRLILASKQFEACRNPSEFDTQKDLSLHLVPRLCGGMPLIVETLPGKMITSDVKTSDMIGNVKANSYRVDRRAIPPSHHCLFLEGQQLEDGRTVQQCYEDL